MTILYEKPALTFEQQADLLIQRGLVVSDRELLIKRLSEVNYYRLSAYWYPFRDQDSEKLIPGTPFETIWRRYMFDRQLRLLVMDPIERIEVSIKTRMVNTFCLLHGPFGHLDKNNFYRKQVTSRYDDFLSNLHRNAKLSREIFVEKSKEKYDGFPDLPLWKTCEIMSFGNMFTMYKLLEKKMRTEIAQMYGLQAEVLVSWIHTLSYVRNLCAHHGKLWDSILAIKPNIPNRKHHVEFHEPVPVWNNRSFAVLTICKYMLNRIAPQSEWKERLSSLFSSYGEIPKRNMGFPENWDECPIWRS